MNPQLVWMSTGREMVISWADHEACKVWCRGEMVVCIEELTLQINKDSFVPEVRLVFLHPGDCPAEEETLRRSYIEMDYPASVRVYVRLSDGQDILYEPGLL